MTKEELAEKYASEQASGFVAKIKEAYLKGYEQGEQNFATTIKVDGVEYIDLGLPSGTLWSRHPLSFETTYGSWYKMLSYTDAQKLNIPTEEQVKELISNRKILYTDGTVYAIGPNSKRIWYKWNINGEGVEGCDYRKCWIKSEAKNNEAKVYLINKDPYDYRSSIISTHFTGYKLPVFLVINKADLK